MNNELIRKKPGQVKRDTVNYVSNTYLKIGLHCPRIVVIQYLLIVTLLFLSQREILSVSYRNYKEVVTDS